MRVTSEMMVTNSLRRLSTRLARYERTQSELATGRRILTPSDDPAGTGRALGLRAQMRGNEQQSRNAADALSRLGAADTQLQTASERLGRVQELLTRGASSTNAAERSALAQEVRAIRDELVGVANTRHGGRPVFGGYTDGDAVAFDGTTWTSAGDGQEVTRRVGDADLVRVNVTAQEAFGFGSAGGDLFTVLGRLGDQLEAGNTGAVAAGLGELGTARGRINSALGVVGAAGNRVESAQRRSDDALLAMRGELAEVEDVDLAEAAMELQVQEVAYEATLQALSRALPPSLMSFLR